MKNSVDFDKFVPIAFTSGPERSTFGLYEKIVWGRPDNLIYADRFNLIVFDIVTKIPINQISRITLRYEWLHADPERGIHSWKAYPTPNGRLLFRLYNGSKFRVTYVRDLYATLVEILWRRDDLRLVHPEILYKGMGPTRVITDLKEFEMLLDKTEEKRVDISYFKRENISQAQENYRYWTRSYRKRIRK